MTVSSLLLCFLLVLGTTIDASPVGRAGGIDFTRHAFTLNKVTDEKKTILPSVSIRPGYVDGATVLICGPMKDAKKFILKYIKKSKIFVNHPWKPVKITRVGRCKYEFIAAFRKRYLKEIFL